MFASGAGVEIVENSGFMTARVYLPWQFINKTRGLFGNWSFDMSDDLTRPDGTVVQTNLNNFESVHRDFAMRWMLSDRETEGVGAGLFTREFGRTASYYANATFLPNFIREPRDFLPPNRTQDIEMVRLTKYRRTCSLNECHRVSRLMICVASPINAALITACRFIVTWHISPATTTIAPSTLPKIIESE